MPSQNVGRFSRWLVQSVAAYRPRAVVDSSRDAGTRSTPRSRSNQSGQLCLLLRIVQLCLLRYSRPGHPCPGRPARDQPMSLTQSTPAACVCRNSAAWPVSPCQRGWSSYVLYPGPDQTLNTGARTCNINRLLGGMCLVLHSYP